MKQPTVIYPYTLILTILMSLWLTGCSTTKALRIKHTSNQLKLAEFAIKETNPKTCIPATKKLTDEALLANVALMAKNSLASEIATRKITDEAVLARVAYKHSLAGKIAITKINDQSVIIDIATSHYCTDGVRIIAISKIADQDKLLKLAEDCNTKMSFRLTAIANLTDKAYLRSLSAYLDSIDKDFTSTKANRKAPSILVHLDRHIIDEIINLRLLLLEPSLIDKFSISQIWIRYEPLSKKYYRQLSPASPVTSSFGHRVSGSNVYLTIYSDLLRKEVSEKWSVNFPSSIDAGIHFQGTHFRPKVNTVKLQYKMLDLCFNTSMKEIANTSPSEVIRISASNALKYGFK